jgi:hypothetical protein
MAREESDNYQKSAWIHKEQVQANYVFTVPSPIRDMLYASTSNIDVVEDQRRSIDKMNLNFSKECGELFPYIV